MIALALFLLWLALLAVVFGRKLDPAELRGYQYLEIVKAQYEYHNGRSPN